jgi:hypothetical protein
VNRLLFGIMWLLAVSAQATPITSFEAGSLAGNGLTLTQGFTERATIETSVTSSTATLTATNNTHLLKMMAGSDLDIINPSFPNQFVTLVDFDNPINIDKAYFLADFAFMGRDTTSSRNDRQLIGINGTLYSIFGATETGYTAPRTLGWQTLAIHFAQTGSIGLSLGCSNDTFDTGSSYCLWDNFRTSDVLPTPELNGLPVIAPFNPIDIGGNTAPIPEPSTYALLIAGLSLLTIAARRRKLATI